MKWRMLLPVGNVLMAVCLLYIGHYHHPPFNPDWHETAEGAEFTWALEPPLAPAIQVVYAINIPALLLASPLRTVNHTAAITGFFCALLIVWYAVGRVIDLGLHRPPRNPELMAAVSLIGVMGSIFGVWFSWQAVGVHYVVPPLGAVVWSLAFGVYCCSVLRNALQTRIESKL